MCGRYTVTVTIEELLLRYMTADPSLLPFLPKFNIAPSQQVPAVIHDGTKNRIGLLKWGLVPSWSRDERSAAGMINARAETLMTKAAFKRLLPTRRCILPADGFYEWKQEEGGKRPMRIVLREGGLFSLAGLYDIWTDSEGRKISSCTIITTSPNELMSSIHHRMPVILRPEDEQSWLDRNNRDIPRLLEMLKPFEDGRLRAYPVSPAVGSVKNDSPELIREIAL